MADDEDQGESAGAGGGFRLPDNLSPYFLLGKGWTTEAQSREGARLAVAVRAAVRAMEDAAGARWTLSVLQDEVARLKAQARKVPHRPKGSKSVPMLELFALAIALPDRSATALAAMLHAGEPRKYGASVAAIAKTIVRLRADIARRGKTAVFGDEIKRELTRRAEAAGIAPEVALDPRGFAAGVKFMAEASGAIPPKRGRDK